MEANERLTDQDHRKKNFEISLILNESILKHRQAEGQILNNAMMSSRLPGLKREEAIDTGPMGSAFRYLDRVLGRGGASRFIPSPRMRR